MHSDLTGKPKLLIQDMKTTIHPVLETGGHYPHHNLYYIVSDTWDMEVLGGILLSRSHRHSSRRTACGCAAAPSGSRPSTSSASGYPGPKGSPRTPRMHYGSRSGPVTPYGNEGRGGGLRHPSGGLRPCLTPRPKIRHRPPSPCSGQNAPTRSPNSLTVGGPVGLPARGPHKGIRDLVKNIFIESGMPADSIVYEAYLPGFYRARKRWDMAVRYKGALVAALEFKSQVGSVGKNINNRFEEALGSGTDTWAAQTRIRCVR